MLLAVDIGNTNISLGLFEGERLLKRYTIATKEKEYFNSLKKIINAKEIKACVICSVVPESASVFKKEIKRLFGIDPLILGKDISVPIKNCYLNPRQVGQDRLVNAYAAIQFYGVPAIVVDFGTAITFDVISKRKEYLGGMIVPGLGISLDALAQKTALLPKIKLKEPKEFIGRDTQNSILSGIVYGFAALSDELIRRIKEKIGRSATVVGTGGNIYFISSYCKKIDYSDINLTLKGINIIFLSKDKE